jgi:hypothetical protein
MGKVLQKDFPWYSCSYSILWRRSLQPSTHWTERASYSIYLRYNKIPNRTPTLLSHYTYLRSTCRLILLLLFCFMSAQNSQRKYAVLQTTYIKLVGHSLKPSHRRHVFSYRPKINPLKTKRISFVQELRAYSAVNTLHVGYKNQSLNAV